MNVLALALETNKQCERVCVFRLSYNAATDTLFRAGKVYPYSPENTENMKLNNHSPLLNGKSQMTPSLLFKARLCQSVSIFSQTFLFLLMKFIK